MSFASSACACDNAGQASRARRTACLAKEITRHRAGLEPVDHEFPLTHITATTCGLDAPPPLSPASQALHASGIVSFEPAREPMLRLVFDDAAEGKTMDLWPTLPLVLEW